MPTDIFNCYGPFYTPNQIRILRTLCPLLRYFTFYEPRSWKYQTRKSVPACLLFQWVVVVVNGLYHHIRSLNCYDRSTSIIPTNFWMSGKARIDLLRVCTGFCTGLPHRNREQQCYCTFMIIVWRKHTHFLYAFAVQPSYVGKRPFLHWLVLNLSLTAKRIMVWRRLLPTLFMLNCYLRCSWSTFYLYLYYSHSGCDGYNQ